MTFRPTRLQADLLLLLTAAIWGLAFVAQKTGMTGIGPLGFLGIRSILSALTIAPLLYLELKSPAVRPRITLTDRWLMAGMALSFFAGVYLQQAGIRMTSVTNAGFLTTLYVVFTPVIALLVFRHTQSFIVWPACALALIGAFLLNGGGLTPLSAGDTLELLCAICFAIQINLMGILARRVQRPALLCMTQHLTCVVMGIGLGIGFEGITLPSLFENAIPLLYAGVISGGIGFTLQALAQQHTPASDAAIIMSAEALFAALGGALLLHERLGMINWLGCALIFVAIVLVEFYPLLKTRDRRAR